MNKVEEKQTFAPKEEIEEKVSVPDVVADDDDDEEDEEELVDPIDVVREQCSRDAESLALLAELQTCSDRVESRNMTEETCQQEQFDFLGHRDHCVAHHIFHHLK